MPDKTFDILLLNGRPAAGKSEIIDFLEKVPLEERIEKFHIGEFDELDDFKILWNAYESDDILEKHGKQRLISKTTFKYEGKIYKGRNFKHAWYYNFMILKLCSLYEKKITENPKYHKTRTCIFEFARGKDHGGWKTAYEHFTDEILRRASTIYIDVTIEEAIRKNSRRSKPGLEDSTLHHSLEDKKMEYMYKNSDWEDFSNKDPNYLLVKNHKIPYAVFENMPEKTDDPDKIGPHLKEVLDKLWKNKTG